MHFVTESELRTKFGKEAFTQFYLNNQLRLTPGAKQFLLDKKIPILSEAQMQQKGETLKQLTTLDGYKEVLSSELLEAALLAMDLQLSISQRLFDIEKTLTQALGQSSSDEETSLAEIEEFQLEAVHIFSEQGSLLIKLKKVCGIIHLIQAEYPQYRQILIKATIKIIELKKQLAGETNEKTINGSM